MNPDETRARILAATDTLFGERGFDATTTRDIEERSGVNKGLIHYHFGNKEDLLTALLDDYYARLTRALAAALQQGADLGAQAAALVDAYADFLAANRTFCAIVQREVASGRHVERLVERTLPAFRLGARWLAALAPRAPDDLGHVDVLTTVYGLVVTYFTYGKVLHALTGRDPFSPTALAARKRHVRRVVALLVAELAHEDDALPPGDPTCRPPSRPTPAAPPRPPKRPSPRGSTPRTPRRKRAS